MLAMVTASAALAGPATASSGQRQQAGSSPVAVAITAINPPYASPRARVQVSGTLTNTSATAISGLVIQLRSAGSPFGYTAELSQYLAGDLPFSDVPVSNATWSPGQAPLQPGQTRSWRISLPAAQIRQMQAAGAYPLAAQVTNSAGGTVAAVDRTLLPYWAPQPAKSAGFSKQQIAWIWPLIDEPQQDPCGGLVSNELAASLGGGGRLAGLLSAGASEAAATRLTWVLDPALLANVQLMRDASGYQVGGAADCNGRRRPASKPAAAWLSELKTATASQPVLLTPYADADMTSLSQHDLDPDLSEAFRLGAAAATAVLGRRFSAAGHGPAAAGQLSGVAWPTDGLANYALLENLAAVDGISTVILDSTTMPPLAPAPPYTPTAVASTPDGEGGDMHVLLSDDTLTQLLATADTATTPAAQFAVAQDFLAETAMFAVQARVGRAIVVAPPRRWDPPAGLAAGLLRETAAAPWLTPVSLGSLAAAAAPASPRRQAPDDIGTGLLRAALLNKVRALDSSVQLLESIRVRPDGHLYQAVAGIESSAWRGSAPAEKPALARLNQVAGYIESQEDGLLIIGSSRVTLGGLRGSVPVSVDNRLRYPVKVQVALRVAQSASNGLIITNPPGVQTVPANTVETFKLKVRATAIGSTTISLGLLNPAGQALPGKYATMTVQATQFGTLALVILAVAVGVFIITSATRGLRRGRAATASAADSAPEAPPADPGSRTEAADQREEADSVVPDRDGTRTDNAPTEDTDDFAWSPGRADRS